MREAETLKQQIVDTFSRAAPTYDQIGESFFGPLGAHLVQRARIPASGDVLDVACGRGAVLFPATQAVGPGGTATGIDFAEGMVEHTAREAARRGLHNVVVEHMDAEHLGFADATFDVVLCGFGVFFMPHPDRAIAEWWRVLKPGGRVAVSTWFDEDERWKWLDTLLKERNLVPPTPPNLPLYRDMSQFVPMLHEAGFAGITQDDEVLEVLYRDAEEWWEVQWSHGRRASLERLDPAAYAQLKADATPHLAAIHTPRGLPCRYYARYTVARKPA
jgi:ubiquinone/menaquinone biosynthesis C-methylase UbiE